MTKTKKVFLIVALLIAGMFVGNVLVKNKERGECRAWHNQASIAEWQQQQCAHYNLPLTGRVRPETLSK